MPNGHILVVEDEDAIRLLLIDYLQEHSGVAVTGARDGVDALHHVSTRKFDVVILDVMMPYMTGIDFLDSLQALSSDPSVRHLSSLPAVVIVTAMPAEQIPTAQIQERFPTLVRAVLRKPVDVAYLGECVRQLLG
jgi:CheY-like chemotaxis protein